MKYNFTKKIAVITGGASGIGLATAKALACSGAEVLIIGRDVKKLKAAQAEIKKQGKCEIYRADVSNPSSVGKVYKAIINRFKKIDILVNCAGVYGPIGKFGTNNIEQWTEALNINLLGTVYSCHAVLPYMLKQKAGKIINLSGGGAVQPFPNFSAYATSKAAVVRFSENIAKEYEENNIQINAIAPGAVNTLFLEKVLKAGVKSAGKDFYKKSLQQKQSGGDSPKLAAELIMFLCSGSLTGKVVSAKWDKWQEWNKKALEVLNRNSNYTLRRIDNKYFYEKNK